MVVLGLWLAIIGYGIAYSGVVKVGGGACTLAQAFKGRCQTASGTALAGAATSSGTTTLANLRGVQAQQAAAIPTTPIPQPSGTPQLVTP